MKQFSLEEFKKNPNRKVVTRDGDPVRILCTDAKNTYPVVALVDNGKGESTENYMPDGKFLEGEEGRLDLFFNMAEKEAWINLSRIGDNIIPSNFMYSKEEAEECSVMYPENFIAIAHVTWEE